MSATVPYGSWNSPITAGLVTGSAIRLGEIRIDGNDIYWIEVRAAEGGRGVIVRRTEDGRIEDVTPAPFYARTRVHEYGGGTYLVHDGAIYFSNFEDQHIHRVTPGEAPVPLTSGEGLRYADGAADSARRRLVLVREDHRGAQGNEPVNAIVGLPLDGGEAVVLAAGRDFYSDPRPSPDGTQLAWLCWDHPHMPWDETELWVARIAEDGSLADASRVAGGGQKSICEPRWSPEGKLHYVSDHSGWWNLYREGEPLCSMEAEFGQPQWQFGLSTWAFEGEESILCVVGESGRYRLARLDTATGTLDHFTLPYPEAASVAVGHGVAALAVLSPTAPTAVARLDLSSGDFAILRRSIELDLDPGYLSEPQAIEFPTTGERTAHAFFYPPGNRDCEAPPGERPPLLVLSHGGPTSATSCALNPSTQYWTSRGIAVLDVNYGGSNGYGRAYRERLKGNWGVVDVEDCIHAAKALIERGDVDPDRIAIRGGSAGGYTTLCALTFHDFFRAGASYYGVSDLAALARDTHKFESRYLDGLLGPYPEAKAIYDERSPIRHTEQLSCPVILLQGLDDPVVPPDQAEKMVEALRRKGLPVAYVPFEGEQHGFRRAENQRRALESEFYFYARVFGYEPADPIEPIPIENL